MEEHLADPGRAGAHTVTLLGRVRIAAAGACFRVYSDIPQALVNFHVNGRSEGVRAGKGHVRTHIYYVGRSRRWLRLESDAVQAVQRAP
jgi:hypothetical protein